MSEKKYRVYRYQNLIVPTASYIGTTGAKYQSWRAGRNGNKYMECSKFGPAIIEYGWPNFKYEVLEDGLTKEEAFEREKYWIQYYDSVNQGYNTSLGGKGCLGVPRSEKQKEIVRQRSLGNKYGLGVIHSEEYKQKMSEKMMNRPDESKKVLRYDKNMVLMAEYPSAHEAARQLGFSRGCISTCCSGKGRLKSYKGSIWRYAS